MSPFLSVCFLHALPFLLSNRTVPRCVQYEALADATVLANETPWSALKRKLSVSALIKAVGRPASRDREREHSTSSAAPGASGDSQPGSARGRSESTDSLNQSQNLKGTLGSSWKILVLPTAEESEFFAWRSRGRDSARSSKDSNRDSSVSEGPRRMPSTGLAARQDRQAPRAEQAPNRRA